MKTKSIKQIVIVVAIILAICAVFALLFFGMSQLLHIDRGQVVAEYDGNLVYESDVQDIINYNLMVGVTDQTTEYELHNIMVNAVKTYVKYKTLEIDLEEKGYVIDEKEFKEALKEAKADIEETYGYKEWCDMYRVSKDFLEEELRRFYIAALYNDNIEQKVQVSEQEARDYYSVHAISDYSKPAGYYWTSVLRPVRDIADQNEAAEAKAEMDAYLAKVLNGEMTLEDVDKELNAKYNEKTAYPNAMYDGEDTIAIDTMYVFLDEKDFHDLLDVIDETYADRDINADEKSEQYANYMSYLANTFEAYVHYALQNMEVGEVWETTLQNFVGSYIIRLDRVETTNAFIPYDEVADEIITLLMAEKLEKNFADYLYDLEAKYDIVYYVN